MKTLFWSAAALLLALVFLAILVHLSIVFGALALSAKIVWVGLLAIIAALGFAAVGRIVAQV